MALDTETTQTTADTSTSSTILTAITPTTDVALTTLTTPTTLANAMTTATATTATGTSTSTNTPSPTWVWITVTKGVVVYATSIAYTQTFTPMYSTIQTYLSGEIGLGTISGNVGEIRTYRYVSN